MIQSLKTEFFSGYPGACGRCYPQPTAARGHLLVYFFLPKRCEQPSRRITGACAAARVAWLLLLVIPDFFNQKLLTAKDSAIARRIGPGLASALGGCFLWSLLFAEATKRSSPRAPPRLSLWNIIFLKEKIMKET